MKAELMETILKLKYPAKDENLIINHKTDKRICIVYLGPPKESKYSNGKNKIEDLIKSMKTTRNYLWNYPIIVFHEDYEYEDEFYIGSKSKCPNAKFVKLNFKQPKDWKPKIKGRPYGYRKMCKFFTNEIQNHKALQKYDYYIRLDHDSFFTGQKELNPIKIIEKYKFDYCYRSTMLDLTDKGTAWEFTKEYAKRNNMSLEHFEKLNMLNEKGEYNGITPYTNFSIINLNFWKRKDVQKYLKEVEEHRGCLDYHWEDTTTNAMVIGLFNARVLEKTDFGYKHNKHKSPRNTLKVIYEG